MIPTIRWVLLASIIQVSLAFVPPSSTSPSLTRSATATADENIMFWPTETNGSQDEEMKSSASFDSENQNDRILDSVLKVHCTHSEPDYLMPWQKTAQAVSTSSGFVVQYGDTLYILTNAHSVEYGSIVQVQRRGDPEKYQATIEHIANECDLAVLKVEDAALWAGLRPLTFGPLPALQDEVQVLGYPTGGESLSITKGVVSRIEMQEYSQSSFSLLSIQIDAAVNAGNSGGPVVDQEWQVIGVAFQGLDDAENIGYVVPVTVVQHVLEDIKRNQMYTGFCGLGVGYGLLENNAFRKYLGVDRRQGIVVRGIGPTSLAKGVLQVNDVILTVDNIKIGVDGKVPFRRGERVDVACYIQTKNLGDMVQLRILRDGQEMTVDVPVGIPSRLVPSHWSNQPPPYLIVSGLVFTALSGPYLSACGVWDDYVSANVSYLSCLYDKSLEQQGDQVVVLIQVLAHRENLGYDTLTDLHLERLNGEKVRSLRHLQQMLQKTTDDFLRFEFSPRNRIIVLERSQIESATSEVCEENSIRSPIFLHDTDDGAPSTMADDESEAAKEEMETK